MTHTFEMLAREPILVVRFDNPFNCEQEPSEIRAKLAELHRSTVGLMVGIFDARLLQTACGEKVVGLTASLGITEDQGESRFASFILVADHPRVKSAARTITGLVIAETLADSLMMARARLFEVQAQNGRSAA